MSAESTLLGGYRAALVAVNGRAVVRGALENAPPPGPVHVLALGKAAEAMLHGAAEAWPSMIVRALVIATVRHTQRRPAQPFPVTRAPGDHPIPGLRSVAAGQAMADFLATVPASQALVVLLSGGASSLAELPCPSITLTWLQKLNERLLAAGADIRTMNALRSRFSRLKGGNALLFCGTDDIRVLVISDIPGDVVASVGSGPFWPREPEELPQLPELGLPELSMLLERSPTPPFAARPLHQLVATNTDARQAVLRKTRADGLPGWDHGPLPANSGLLAACRLVQFLRHARRGVHVWGGEAPVQLPVEPGRGGRAQHLAALMLLLWDRRGWPEPIEVFCAATDGVDGNSGAAGAWFGPSQGPLEPERRDALRAALRRADTASFWEEIGHTVRSSVTDTNVMDLLIVKVGR